MPTKSKPYYDDDLPETTATAARQRVATLPVWSLDELAAMAQIMPDTLVLLLKRQELDGYDGPRLPVTKLARKRVVLRQDALQWLADLGRWQATQGVSA